ncbi:hypothetical protein FNV43_RR19996 [Rhamnella rubrinervis]|uniref:Uncharacterized protein n=1 Tax=Rhamnella rubrinervis TaxID=2594499 RepID=A0A8K0DXW6_9ROSA|nr:hypothetical protein FNV43_RR19996 [Rhamnella rubrinervis]
MAMKRVAGTAIQAFLHQGVQYYRRRPVDPSIIGWSGSETLRNVVDNDDLVVDVVGLCASPGGKKIVGVFYKAGEYAKLNPNFVGCVEGALGIRDWLESQGHQYIVTDDKEGLDCGCYI